jgi:hypothetical protein
MNACNSIEKFIKSTILVIMKLYLSFSDHVDAEVPRKILQYKKILINNRNVLVVEVDEPIIGQTYGFGGTDIKKLYLVNRYVEDVLAFNVFDKFPIDVYVLIPPTLNIIPSNLKEFMNIAWAWVYDNEVDAKKRKIISKVGRISRL